MINIHWRRFIVFLPMVLLLAGGVLIGCGGGSAPPEPNPVLPVIPAASLDWEMYDRDGDYLPDAFERQQGSDPDDPDQNNNGVLDGLEGDPFFGYQWYLRSEQPAVICNTNGVETVAGNDLSILPLYHYTLGNNRGMQSIQVVDGGVDEHPDIDLDRHASINSVTGSDDPTPVEGFSGNPVQLFYRGHGTAVAGVIGARALNDQGIRGVAPMVRIAGSNWLETEDIAKLEAVWCHEGNISISNNSWGTKVLDDPSYEAIIEKASGMLRDGKGRIFVFAGGNEREEHSNANLSYLLNNPYVIAVSALNHENKYASYATPGSDILISAYGGEHYYTAPTIMTTFTPLHAMTETELHGRKGPVTVEADSNRSYTYAMNGSSAAAPMVSGALALVLDMCPSLSWRDVRWLTAVAATRIDPSDPEWIQNAAKLWHNNNYGFGRINPMRMIEICLSDAYHPLPAQSSIEKESSISVPIPDDNSSITKTFVVHRDIQIDWVAVTVQIDHPYAGDIAIDLISPLGTISHLIEPNFMTFNAYEDGFRLSTVSLMGERSRGLWKVRIRDSLKDDTGVLEKIKLDIRGYDL